MTTRLEQVRELLRSEDIEGLISMGAPADEYDSEAEMVAERVQRAESVAWNGRLARDEVIAILASVWKEMFDLSDRELAPRRDAFETIATRVAP